MYVEHEFGYWRVACKPVCWHVVNSQHLWPPVILCSRSCRSALAAALVLVSHCGFPPPRQKEDRQGYQRGSKARQPQVHHHSPAINPPHPPRPSPPRGKMTTSPLWPALPRILCSVAKMSSEKGNDPSTRHHFSVEIRFCNHASSFFTCPATKSIAVLHQPPPFSDAFARECAITFVQQIYAQSGRDEEPRADGSVRVLTHSTASLLNEGLQDAGLWRGLRRQTVDYNMVHQDHHNPR
jgi:hypothetical protein